MKTKAIERVFTPNEIPVLKFEIKKVHSQYDNLTQELAFEALDFLDDCIKGVKRFKQELKEKYDL